MKKKSSRRETQRKFAEIAKICYSDNYDSDSFAKPLRTLRETY